jgi:tripartite-type tricarboxylate transporter receptor subunit TctC
MFSIARTVTVAAALAVAPFALAVAASAQQAWPTKPIRWLIPYPPGGGTDIVARALAPKMQEALGQTLIIENRPGASEVIATDLLAKAEPDGYTIGLATQSLPINAGLRTDLPFDVDKDFQPVTVLVIVPFVMVVNPAVPVSTIQELVVLAKKEPGKLNFAHIGTGTPHFLAMEWFKQAAGIDIVGIPYKGVAPGMAAVASGEAQLSLTGLTAGMAQVKAGKLKALAVATAKRNGAAPELPTVAESGYPDFSFDTWYGLFLPAKTPRAIVDRLNAAVRHATSSTEVKERFAAAGIEPASSSPEALGALVQREKALWGRIIKTANIKPD